jgi:hypothetical protein
VAQNLEIDQSKSDIADQQSSSIFVARVEKQKTYEVTKPQTISWRDRHHWSRIVRIGLHRSVGAAGSVSGDDDHNLGRCRHGRSSQAT